MFKKYFIQELLILICTLSSAADRISRAKNNFRDSSVMSNLTHLCFDSQYNFCWRNKCFGSFIWNLFQWKSYTGQKFSSPISLLIFRNFQIILDKFPPFQIHNTREFGFALVYLIKCFMENGLSCIGAGYNSFTKTTILMDMITKHGTTVASVVFVGHFPQIITHYVFFCLKYISNRVSEWLESNWVKNKYSTSDGSYYHKLLSTN